MTQTPQRCLFTEGSISLPPGYQEKTINILSSSQANAPGLNISRDTLSADQTLADYVSGQLQQLEKQMKKWRLESRQPLEAGATLPAGELICASYRVNDQRVWQIQAVFALENRRILVFTLSRGSALQPSDHQLIRDLLAGFTPPPPATGVTS